MTLYGAGLIFALLFLGVIYVLVARKVWQGESALDGDVPPQWWFFGDVAWRGVARAYIASAPFILLFFAGGLVAEVTDADDLGMAMAALALLLAVVVHASILLWNRPQSLVPPHLRDEPGALAERRARKQRRAVG